MDAETTGIVIGSGSVGAICGVIGAWIKAKFGQKATVTPNPSPFPVETQQAHDQIHWKENAKDHENLFTRVGKVEQTVAGLVERDHAQDRTIDRMANQVDKLYDRIIGGKKK